MKEIPLTKGKVALVDDDDFERVNLFSWFLSGGEQRNTNYARGYILKDGEKVAIPMHRFILDLFSDEFVVDHVDGNGLNNTRKNIRVATVSQNLANRFRNKNSKWPYKGIFLDDGRWRSRITVKGKRINLGSFDSAEEAACAYDIAAMKYFGEFANLNFPENREKPAEIIRGDKRLQRAMAFTINGETKTLSQWSVFFGISPSTVRYRVEHGMEALDALTKPITPFSDAGRLSRKGKIVKQD